MRCTLCEQDASLKETWGCERPRGEAVWQHEGDFFMSCPLQFIPPEAIEWYQEYDYCAVMGGMEYTELPWSWIEAFRAYRSAMAEFERQRLDESRRKHDSLRSLKSAASKGTDDG